MLMRLQTAVCSSFCKTEFFFFGVSNLNLYLSKSCKLQMCKKKQKHGTMAAVHHAQKRPVDTVHHQRSECLSVCVCASVIVSVCVKRTEANSPVLRLQFLTSSKQSSGIWFLLISPRTEDDSGQIWKHQNWDEGEGSALWCDKDSESPIF